MNSCSSTPLILRVLPHDLALYGDDSIAGFNLQLRDANCCRFISLCRCLSVGLLGAVCLRTQEPELSRPSRCGIPMDKFGCPCCLGHLPAVVYRSGSQGRFFTLVKVALSYPVYFFAAVRGRRVPHPFRVINPTDPQLRVRQWESTVALPCIICGLKDVGAGRKSN
jgi:hypothetical protein